jgi:hypothetical protein
MGGPAFASPCPCPECTLHPRLQPPPGSPLGFSPQPMNCLVLLGPHRPPAVTRGAATPSIANDQERAPWPFANATDVPSINTSWLCTCLHPLGRVHRSLNSCSLSWVWVEGCVCSLVPRRASGGTLALYWTSGLQTPGGAAHAPSGAGDAQVQGARGAEETVLIKSRDGRRAAGGEAQGTAWLLRARTVPGSLLPVASLASTCRNLQLHAEVGWGQAESPPASLLQVDPQVTRVSPVPGVAWPVLPVLGARPGPGALRSSACSLGLLLHWASCFLFCGG